MKICESCKSEHNQPRSPLCVACQRRRNVQKCLERKRNPNLPQVVKKSEDEKKEIHRKKALEYYRKKRGYSLDYIPTYRSSEKKKCSTCQSEHDRPRSDLCLQCQRKLANKLYGERHREKIMQYQKKYRGENWDLVLERRKRSYDKNPEHYRKKSLEYFIKKKGLSPDYKRWKKRAGEGSITHNGYKVLTCPIKDHPNAYDSKGRIAEHTWVMIQKIGRPLHKGETVHHINGDRLDNRIENLELWHRSHPPGQRVEDKVSWAIEFLSLYGYRVEKRSEQ